jgi:hypothetical protein
MQNPNPVMVVAKPNNLVRTLPVFTKLPGKLPDMLVN